MKIPSASGGAILERVNCSGQKTSCVVHEVAIQEDHIHVLATVPNEHAGARFISKVVDDVRTASREADSAFDLCEQLHVTLLPPWHVSILASFLRDQDRYHKDHSVDDEIVQIFQPNTPVSG